MSMCLPTLRWHSNELVGAIVLKTNRLGIANQSAEEFFNTSLNAHKDILIASGYFGQDILRGYYSKLVEKSNDGGRIILINGMGAWEGIPKNQEEILRNLDDELRKNDPKSGIYFQTTQRYHGKIYLFETGEDKIAMLGSSNFSGSGFRTNLEGNIVQREPKVVQKIKEFTEFLIGDSKPINKISLPTKGVSKKSIKLIKVKTAPKFVVPTDIMSRPVDFQIPVLVRPRSGVNLTFGAGRKDSKTGKYTPRPYYEVEITLGKRYWVPPMTKFVDATSTSATYFEAYTDTDQYFEVAFSPKSKNQSLSQSGGDFMSSPRELLGRYIKSKLISAGSMSYGDPITEEVLADYGNDKILVRVFDVDKLHLQF